MASDQTPFQPEALKPLASGSNAFGLKLLQSIEEKNTNCALSPISIACALGMLYLGAEDRTAQQLAEVLGFSKTPSEVETWFHNLQAYANILSHAGDPSVDSDSQLLVDEASGDLVLKLANAIWGQKEYPFRPEYIERVKKAFSAHVENMQFLPTPEVAIEMINQWVSKHTHGRIREIMDENLPWGFVRLILTNALYFKGSWEHQFNEADNAKEPFNLADGSTGEAEFMRQEETFGYYHSEEKDFKALEMKYVYGSLSMMVILPGKNDGLPTLEKWLTGERLEKLCKKMRWKPVKVIFPKFLIENQFSLNETLTALGAGDVFDQGKADIPGIAEIEPVWVSEVLHKVWIDVNEKGTEAAAVTAVMTAMGIDDSEPPAPEVFCADHPFLFCIRDRATGLVYFLGRVVSP
ncbi:MAG: serpin family protein [Candidatus Nitronauta litoralis]|uniref:Serpin family protein n=1 Tax=Candidatus Nitronauta litoralis TaxID=2705533 RepID=A0A7T0BW05_9BACT|nr:MAG: serpin family protein [Candidatus Nitronauta litoralis]